MRIAIDAMGGDNAPQSIIEGVNKIIQELPEVELLLVGDRNQLEPHIIASEQVHYLHTLESIKGNDDPVKAIRQNKDASMVLAAREVREGRADVLLSAGNTGALLAAGLLIVGRIKSIDRPGLMPVIPTGIAESSQLILMDAGANAMCKPVNLYQFAVLATYYAQKVLGIESPRVGLLNNGTEETKGNDLAKAAFELLNNSEDIAPYFVGNIEAKELLSGKVDIVVTDGFTGNAVLKTLEGTSKHLFKVIKHQLLNSGLKAKLGGLLIKDALVALRDDFDDTKAGGAVLLGVKAPVIKAHGSSNGEAIYNAIRQAVKVVDSQFIGAVDTFFNEKILEND